MLGDHHPVRSTNPLRITILRSVNSDQCAGRNLPPDIAFLLIVVGIRLSVFRGFHI